MVSQTAELERQLDVNETLKEKIQTKGRVLRTELKISTQNIKHIENKKKMLTPGKTKGWA